MRMNVICINSSLLPLEHETTVACCNFSIPAKADNGR